MPTYKVNDTREVMRSNAAIKAQLNAEAHAERMRIYDALYNECERLLVAATLAEVQGNELEADRQGVMLTSQRAVLRHHVEQISGRVKLRGT